MKYSQNFDRDWDFYTKNIGKFTFWGGDHIHEPKFDDNGLDAKAYFHKLDSQGLKKVEKLSCKEPALVSEVLRFKKGLNFHIKQWVEGYDDMLMGIGDYMAEFIDPPDWVAESLINQLAKARKKKQSLIKSETRQICEGTNEQ